MLCGCESISNERFVSHESPRLGNHLSQLQVFVHLKPHIVDFSFLASAFFSFILLSFDNNHKVVAANKYMHAARSPKYTCVSQHKRERSANQIYLFALHRGESP